MEPTMSAITREAYLCVDHPSTLILAVFAVVVGVSFLTWGIRRKSPKSSLLGAALCLVVISIFVLKMLSKSFAGCL